MLYEFAVDPRVLTSWKDMQLALERFGVHRGRLVARYPKNWRRRVVDAADQNPDLRPVDRQRVVERLNLDLPSRMWRHGEGRFFDGNRSWLDNARTCMDGDLRFRAVVADANAVQGNWVLAWDDLTDSGPELWRVSTSRAVRADADSMAECVAPIFRNSREILLVHPYFQPWEAECLNPLRALAAMARREAVTLQRLEVHTGCSDGISDDHFRRLCEEHLPDRIPHGVRIELLRWDQRGAGPRLLDRFVLTDVVGVLVSHDLRERPGAMTEFRLMEEPDRVSKWAQFHQGTSPFELAQQFTIVGRG